MKHETIKQFVSSFLYLCREYGFTKVVDGTEYIVIPNVPDCLKEEGIEPSRKVEPRDLEKTVTPVIPTAAEVKAYADSIGYYNFDSIYFLSYYTNKGWSVAGQPIFDWRGLVRKWKENQSRKV